jgi:UDP-N-acetylglucosamine diphosphorylase/glucosamine-1-phosphate N-acetyltransferase
VICIFEDEGISNLVHLVDLRAVFDLRCGRNTLFEKFRKLYPREEIHLWVRDELAEVTAEAHPDCRVNRPVRKGRLFLSGRVILNKPVSPKGPESVLMCGDEVVGFRVCAECAVKMSSLAGLKADLAVEQVKGKVVKWPWNLVEFNADELRREASSRKDKGQGKAGKGRRTGKLEPGVLVAGSRAKLVVQRGARVWPGAVLSTETGPIEIDERAEVRPGSFVEGPCYVGPGTIIDGAKVRPGCSFGPQCRVGGEVEASMFQGYANKHHDGFIGHCFVGEWVNLGAMTTNSDLKNSYRPVKVAVNGKETDTGLTKVGCFFGDHVKTAIGSLFNTGAMVGTFANWFEPGLSPKVITSFAWGNRARWSGSDMVTNARLVMARRGVEMTPAYERLLKSTLRRTRRQRR